MNPVGTPKKGGPDNYIITMAAAYRLYQGPLLSVAYLINPLKKPGRQVLSPSPAEGTKVTGIKSLTQAQKAPKRQGQGLEPVQSEATPKL